MRIASTTLEHLHACDPDVLARECEGIFPLAELNEAARTGEASSDLAGWLEAHRERSMAGEDAVTDEVLLAKKSATYNGGPHGTRMDAPPDIDPKNYEQGTPDEEPSERQNGPGRPASWRKAGAFPLYFPPYPKG